MGVFRQESWSGLPFPPPGEPDSNPKRDVWDLSSGSTIHKRYDRQCCYRLYRETYWCPLSRSARWVGVCWGWVARARSSQGMAVTSVITKGRLFFLLPFSSDRSLLLFQNNQRLHPLRKRNQTHSHRGQACGCRRHRGGGGQDWGSGVNRCPLLHIEQMNRKVLLDSTGNSSPYPVIEP